MHASALHHDLRIGIHGAISDIARDAWNGLVRDNHPFLHHEFLQALEQHGCVGETFGWLPCHLSLSDGQGLVAALPLYEKYNGYGEFVFDHAWADAYRRSGLRYYPKLVSAIPYTPATGQRLLCRPGAEAWAWPLLLQTALQLAEQRRASGLHLLFPPDGEQSWLVEQGLVARNDCQFHWQNPGYRDFDDFLDRFNNRKRKNVRQERRRAQEAGIELVALDGHSASEADWARFALFYNRTFEEKWGIPTLNQGFFQAVAAALPEQVLLIMARRGNEAIAGALMFRSDSVLYGRHWGCVEQVNSLHFEACYYQGIDYAIQKGLTRFEPGAQGEHKIARGFEPTRTQSAHWIAAPGFRPAIARFCQDERAGVAHYIDQAREQLPFKRTESANERLS